MTDINAVVEHYVKLRDHKALLDAEHKARVAEIDAQMKNAESFLLGHLNETGLDRMGTSAGTVYVTVKTMPSIKDRSALTDYIKATGQIELLQMRVSALPSRSSWSTTITSCLRVWTSPPPAKFLYVVNKPEFDHDQHRTV